MKPTPLYPPCLNLPRDPAKGQALRLARYRKAPELGPKLLFFSGGTALKKLSEVLTDYTHNSIHLVTPFDSGGSSAELRRTFAMPAVGDLRARLLSLADDSVTGHPEIAALFSHRLQGPALDQCLQRLVSARHPLLKAIAEPMRSLIQSYLGTFYRQMPADFKLEGASVGNLILTGGYLMHDRSLDPIAFLFSQLIKTRGIVRTTTDADLQLEVCLANGRTIVGQHNFTGKERAPIEAPIRSIKLSGEAHDIDTQDVSRVCKETLSLIHSAELLVFPPGSFYSSVIANLLPKGVTKALHRTRSPKVYVPSLGTDLETLGMTLIDQIKVLDHHLLLRSRHPSGSQPDGKRSALDFLLFDSRLLQVSDTDIQHIKRALGVQVIDTDLMPAKKAVGVSPEAAELAGIAHYDDTKLAEALLALT